jgi:hypothetical protein
MGGRNYRRQLMSKKSTESLQTYAASLAKENKFDPSALPANREGNLTAGQRSKLYLMLVSILFSSVLGIGLGIFFFITGMNWFPKEEPLSEGIMVLVSIIAFLFGMWWIYEGGKQLLRSGRPLLSDIAGGKLAIEKGQVKKEYDDQYYRSMWHRLLDWGFGFFSESDERYDSNMFSGTHFYIFRDQKFIVSQKGYNALDEDITHILYFTPSSKRLINIEPVSK